MLPPGPRYVRGDKRRATYAGWVCASEVAPAMWLRCEVPTGVACTESEIVRDTPVQDAAPRRVGEDLRFCDRRCARRSMPPDARGSPADPGGRVDATNAARS